MILAIGTATIDLTVSSDEYSPEMLGDGYWDFQFSDLKRFADETMDVASEYGMFDPDETPADDDTFTVTNADDAIMILYRMGRTGERFNVAYSGTGSAYWAFHDIDHARNDVNDTDDGKGQIYIDDGSEDRALLQGALLAMENGVSIADIIRQLAKAEPDFQERFGWESTSLDEFAKTLETKLQTQNA